MDRWTGRDGRDDGDDSAAQRPAGQVARTGLHAFIKADAGNTTCASALCTCCAKNKVYLKCKIGPMICAIGMGSNDTVQHRPATVTMSRRQQAQVQQVLRQPSCCTAASAMRDRPNDVVDTGP